MRRRPASSFHLQRDPETGRRKAPWKARRAMTARLGAVVQILAERWAVGRRKDEKLQAVRVLAMPAVGSGLRVV